MEDTGLSPYLRRLFETMADGAMLVDGQGRVVQVNPALERLTGLSPQALQGQPYYQIPWRFVGENGQPITEDDLRGLLAEIQSGPIQQYVLGWRRQEAPEVTQWIEASLSTLYDEAGALLGGLAVLRDITAQRAQSEALEREMATRTAALEGANARLRAEVAHRERLQVKLRETLSLLRATLEGTADGILVRDLQGKPRLFNRRFREIFGKRPTPLTLADAERPDLPLLDEYADREEAREQFRVAMAHPDQERVDELRLKDGRLIERHNRPQVLRGQVAGRVSTYRDITAQRQLEEMLRQRSTYLWSVLEASPTIIFVRDLEGRYQLVNRTLADIYGLPMDDFIGRTALEVGEMAGVPQEESASYLQEDRRILATGEMAVVMSAFTRQGQETRWFETIKAPLCEDGRILGVLGVATDRTEQRRTLAALQASEARYRDLVQNAPVGILTFDVEGKVVEANAQALRILGAPSAEALRGLNLLRAEAQPIQARAEIRHDLEEVLRNGQVRSNELPLRTLWEERHGTMRYHLAPMHDGEGRIVGVQGIVEDVSAYRQMQEQLRQAAKLQAVGQLAGGVAHNFNNLLTVINGYAELALTGLAPDDPLQNDLTQIYRAGRQAADLTRQLLVFSRRQAVEVTRFDLNAALQGLSGMLSSLLGDAVALRYELAPQALTIRADRTQVEQMAINLAINARDAMPQGGTLTIRTRAATLGEATRPRYLSPAPGRYAIVEISDTGHGMSREVQERLFEPFFTTKPVDRGTGLGLATVYGAVEELGGGLDVESAPGRGATFRLYLPLAGEAGADQAGQGDLPRGRERILLVEDRQEVRAATALLLQRLGYQVSAANGPREALALCHSQVEPFDLLLADVMMPDMSGVELARSLPGMCCQAKVLLMTGSAADDPALATGHDLPLIAKPFTLEQLAHAVRAALGPPLAD